MSVSSKIATSSVEDQRHDRERPDGGRQLGEAPIAILAGPAHEAHGRPVFVGHHPPAVVFLLVDPAGTVEGLGDLRRGHRLTDSWQHRATGDYVALSSFSST
jgi:hypothetical protein